MGCQLPTVNKFLFCLSLQAGGKVIGCLAAISSALGFIAFGYTLILVIITGISSEFDTDSGAVAG